MKELLLRNSQRARALDRPALERAARVLLDELLGLGSYQVAIHFVTAGRMAEMNWRFLSHEGSTDVITFDYRQGYGEAGSASEALDLAGEIFISVADAVAQGKAFQRPWEEELIRYMVHGVLHLRGYDDLETAPRRKMKAVENRLVKKLAERLA